jgi:type II secretory pathway component PulF
LRRWEADAYIRVSFRLFSTVLMLFGSPQIDLTRLAELCRRVGLSLQAGVDIRRVWASEVERAGDAAERGRLEQVRDAVATGTSMADALAGRTPRKMVDHDTSTDERLLEAGHTFRPADAPFDGDGYFPPLVCELVEVGERSGRTDEVFTQLADHYDHVLALRSQFASAMAWPILQLVAALAIVGFLIWIAGILGGIAGNRADPPVDFIGLGLIGTSGLIIYIGGLTLIGSAGLIAWIAVERGWLGFSLAEIGMRIWYLGDCLRAMALARFSWSLAATHGAGMDARRAMSTALRSTENAWFTRHAGAIDAVLREGRMFHESLAGTGVFPREFLDTLHNAEEAGRISESLMRQAARYDEEAKIASRTLTTIASGLCWAIVAGLIIVLIFRLFFWYKGMIESFIPR